MSVFRGKPDDLDHALRCFDYLESIDGNGCSSEQVYCIGDAVGQDPTMYHLLARRGAKLLRGAAEQHYLQSHKGNGQLPWLPLDATSGAVYISYYGAPALFRDRDEWIIQVNAYLKMIENGSLEKLDAYLREQDPLSPLVFPEYRDIMRGSVRVNKNGVMRRGILFEKKYPKVRLVVMGQEETTSLWNMKTGAKYDLDDWLDRNAGMREPLLLNIGSEPVPIVCTATDGHVRVARVSPHGQRVQAISQRRAVAGHGRVAARGAAQRPRERGFSRF